MRVVIDGSLGRSWCNSLSPPTCQCVPVRASARHDPSALTGRQEPTTQAVDVNGVTG